MALVCSVYGSEHRQLKRRTLILAFLDLIFITTTIAFAIIQLISVINYSHEEDSVNNNLNRTFNGSVDNKEVENVTDSVLQRQIHCETNNSSSDGCVVETLSYRDVIGARISLSVQLIVYFSQLAFGILLIIAAYHNDSRSLHLWVIFSEVVVVLIFLNLLINFFGKYVWSSVILTFLYVLFKIFLIRLVARFIRQNDLELTQFGSVGDFD